VTAFVVACAVMLAGAIACVVVPLLRPAVPSASASDGHTARARVSAAVWLFALPICAAALYATISNYPWKDPARLTEKPLTADSPIEEVVARLERHLVETPDDAEGWRLLGRSYLVMGRREAAIDALQKAYDAGDHDVDVGLDLAEAMVLAEDGRLDQRAKPLIDAGLAADPNNAKALWYAGVVALRARDVETAKRHWTAMLAQNPPPDVRNILVRQLISMGATPESLGVTGQLADAPGGTQPSASQPSGRTIDVRVGIDPALAARATPGVALFVSARQPGIPGPPLAAVRIPADRWPVSVQLSDANAMIAGRNLSSVDEVEVTARIAFGGTAMTATGDLVGRALRRRDDTGPLDIRIDTVAQ